MFCGINSCIQYLGDGKIASVMMGVVISQTIALQRGSVEEALQRIKASHLRSQEVLLKLQLQPLNSGRSGVMPHGQRVPAQYVQAASSGTEKNGHANEAGDKSLQRQGSSQAAWTEYCPPASSSADAYTLLKFFAVDESLVGNAVALHCSHCSKEIITYVIVFS